MLRSVLQKKGRERQLEGVHVTFGDHKRVISFNKGENEVEVLRHQFLRVFSDVLGGQVAPAEVMFQRYHDSFQDFVDISDEVKLEEGDKVKAMVPHCDKDKGAASGTCFPGFRGIKVYLPIVCKEGLDNLGDPYKEHPIQNDTSYRLWNPLSKENGGLLQRNPSSNVVLCNGTFSEQVHTVVKAQVVHRRSQGPLYGFIFMDAQDRYAMRANGANGANITAQKINNDPLDDECLFEPDYYWSYTMLKSVKYSDYYLGCDTGGKATLVTIGSPFYPDPQTLFIFNKHHDI